MAQDDDDEKAERPEEKDKEGETGKRPEEKSALRRFFARGLVKWGLVAVAAVVCAVGGYFYYIHQQHYPTTDDAYIRADIVHIAPLVAGEVSAVPAADQQTVKAGDLLFRIDPRSFQYQVTQAQAALEAAHQSVGADTAAVDAAQATVKAKEATLANTSIELNRATDLVAHKNAPQSRLDDAEAAQKSAVADLNLAKAQLVETQKTLGQAGDQNTRVQQAEAALQQAQLDLQHTQIRATCAGSVSGLTLRPGEVLQVGQPEGVLVCSSRFWVYANYKETDLARLRPGQAATISLDMYPDRKFHGIVESIDPAAGTAFSLLPPENATGNWVKVTQRVPVRILVTDAGERYPMRVQTSASVTVDTGTQDRPKGLERGVTLPDDKALALAQQDGLGAGEREP